MKAKEVKGKLVIVGGAEDKASDSTILKEFVRLAGGSKARIVVMTAATNLPEEVGDEYTKTFERIGVREVRVVDVSHRQDTSAEESLAALEAATGVYFTGGNQLHITSLLGGTQMLELLHKRHERGVVIGGTSAGAAMMSHAMMLGGESDAAPRFGAVEIGPGLEFMPHSMIDTHFSQRGRHGRLLTAVAHYPQDLGFGVDENTAMVVEDGSFRVIGENTVTIMDAGAITYTSLPDLGRDEALTLHDVRVHVLAAGHSFDWKARTPICEQPTKRDAPAKARAKTQKADK
jgi:cyanophycinase